MMIIAMVISQKEAEHRHQHNVHGRQERGLGRGRVDGDADLLSRWGRDVDFLIIDFHLEKQVTYKGIDVLREIRKHDSTIYAVLLTNYELDDFADQFGDYDYELQKSEITSRYKDVAEKIKRACGLRKENLMYRAVEIKQQQDTETIRLLHEISSKLDEKK